MTENRGSLTSNEAVVSLDSILIVLSKAMVLCLSLATIVFLCRPTSALDIRDSHCFAGCPTSSVQENSLIIRPAYTLSYNSETKVADWATYSVSVDSIGIASNLSRTPIPDNYVLDTLTPDDYASETATDFLYGQLVPLLNFAGTPFWQDTSYSSNGIPISKSLNTGAWYGLDWAIRNLVNRVGQVFVIAGPIYFTTPQVASLETNKLHRVPDAYFKVVVSEAGENSVFILGQQVPVHTHHCNLISTIGEVEGLTGLTLFPELSQLPQDNLDAALGCN